MWLVIFIGCLCSGTMARAQVWTNQLHFAFTDAPGTTASPSDTALNPGAIVTSVTMYNAASPKAAVDLHGAVGSGVANIGVVDNARALDLTADIISSQTNQPANTKPTASATGTSPASGSGNAALVIDTNDAALAQLGNSGVIGPFAATIWMKIPWATPSTTAPRIWILNSTNGVAAPGGLDTGGTGGPGALGLKFQQNNQIAFGFGADNNTVLGTSPGAIFPTNTWMFIGVIYDGNKSQMYYATQTSGPQLIGQSVVGGTQANRTYNIVGGADLTFGNRYTTTTYSQRGLDGWLNDFRFYSGGTNNGGNAAFMQSVWAQAMGNPPVVTGSYPDGLLLLENTNNTFSFNANSPIGLNITNVTLQLNGVPVSSSLLTIVTNGTAGTSSNLSYSYPYLVVNQNYTAVISLQDANGSIGGSTVNFDTFSPTNFIWEAEEFDGTTNGTTPQFFIDNPDYTATNGDPNSYFGLDSIEGIDTHKGSGNPATSITDYRNAGALAPGPYKTQTPTSTDLNREKFILASLAEGTNAPGGVVDHMVANWATAEWQNYTKTFPAGAYNIYGRLSSSAAAVIDFDQVTGGAGTTSQTLKQLGVFNFNTGSATTWAYVPLVDGLGNPVIVTNLAGLNTVRVTSGGGANANFYMLVAANTNLPTITGLYPNGLFDPTNKLAFSVSSAVGVSTNSIHLTVNGINVFSNLVFSGTSNNWTVTYPYLTNNNSYALVINVTDVNGNNANNTVNVDTYNPVFTWEAEDFDFGGGQYIDNPLPTTTPATAANSYCERISEQGAGAGVIGSPGIDAQSTGTPEVSAGDYRESDIISCTPCFDAPRALFTTNNNAQDYALGFIQSGYWENYTKTYPSGTFNVYGRMANGQNPAATVSASLITEGWGTTNQFTRSLGTFTVPNVGWSAFGYDPLMDKYGNYANVTLNGTNTIRITENAAANINFYMLIAARTDLPRFDNPYPDGSVLLQGGTNTFAFTASSPTYGIATSNIQVTINGINVSNQLVFSGSSTSWTVSYPGLVPNTSYTAVVNIKDNAGQVHSPVTVTFDTFNPANFTWEGEDFDFDPANSPVPSGNGLRFIDNPVPGDAYTEATNVYFGQIGDGGIDYSLLFSSGSVGTYVYRSSDFVSTEVTTDAPRVKYQNAAIAADDTGIVDYDINHLGSGEWINYTRTYPTGTFNLYARLSAGANFKMQLAQVTNGVGTSVQSSNVLGYFVGTGTAFTPFQYVPLVNTNTGKTVLLSLGGVETLQIEGDTNENANFFMLVPASGVSTNPATANFSFTVSGGGGGGGGGSKTLNFNWAPDHLGWQLYSNSVGLAASGSWFPVPGSSAVTNEGITLNPSNTNVFFQLRYP